VNQAAHEVYRLSRRQFGKDDLMPSETTIVAGIEVPSTSPIFLTVVGFHVLMGLACVVTGAIAMLSPKRQRRHPTFGLVYFWCLSAVFASATGLSVVRWAQDYHLFILGAVSFAAALVGRISRRHQWPRWLRLHVTGMGASYILLLTAFYVDNGKSLLLWKELPPIAFWLLPSAVGIPIMIHAMLQHPVVRRVKDFAN
jgi:uncharacterized membrane protein